MRKIIGVLITAILLTLFLGSCESYEFVRDPVVKESAEPEIAPTADTQVISPQESDIESDIEPIPEPETDPRQSEPEPAVEIEPAAEPIPEPEVAIELPMEEPVPESVLDETPASDLIDT
ncbi:MAG: hypothetical protein HQ557_13795, partial [Bacteroidetes bacterium]|nr:hypothetical protein [Bacteroidota bacterium]